MTYIIKIGEKYISDIYRHRSYLTIFEENAFRWKNKKTAERWAKYFGGEVIEHYN